MLTALFDSGAVAALGIGVLLLEALWCSLRRGAVPHGFLASGGFLLAALGLALRDAALPWIGLAMVGALLAHLWDLRSR